MRPNFNLKSTLLHTLNVLGTQQNTRSSPRATLIQANPQTHTSPHLHTVSTNNTNHVELITTPVHHNAAPTHHELAMMGDDEKNLTTHTYHQIAKQQQLQQLLAHNPLLKMFIDVGSNATLQHLLTTLPPFIALSDKSALQRIALRENNAAMIHTDLSATHIFQLLNQPKVKREVSLQTAVNDAPQTNRILKPSGFPYLNQTVTKYETFFSALLQQEKIRTQETEPTVEARIGHAIRDFLKQLIHALPLQNYSPALDTPIPFSSAMLCHDVYDQLFSALPISHDALYEGKLCPNLREYLYILYKIEKARELNSPTSLDEISKNILLLVASMRINATPDIRSQERAQIFTSTDGMRDYYCQQAFDLTMGQQALTLDQRFDWNKVAAHIYSPAQAFAAVLENLPEAEQIQYKQNIDNLGQRFTQAGIEEKPLLNTLSNYSDTEKTLFLQAALIYSKAHHPQRNLKGEELLSLQHQFALTVRDDHQKKQIFLPSTPSDAPTSSSAIFFGEISLQNAQGKNFNQLLHDPSLQNIPGFSVHSPEEQTRLLRERLIEKGENPDPRYPIGSFFHSVASVLIRVLQMQGQAIPSSFGTDAELMQRFIETSNTWQSIRNAPIDPRILLGLHLAASSHEAIINPDSSLEQKMQAINAYIQARWSVHMGETPTPFNRRQTAISILVQKTHRSPYQIENQIKTFSEMITGAITSEKRMTLLNYFLHCASRKKTIRLNDQRIRPDKLLQQAEEQYNHNLKTSDWIINRAKETLREQGIAITSNDALNQEIKRLVKIYKTQTEEEMGTERLLHISEQIPILGSFISLIDGITSHDKDKIIGAIPVIGQAYNLEEGIRTHDAQRAIGAIPILGSGQSVIQSIRSGDAVGTYMSALGFMIDIETSGPGIAHAASRGVETATSAIRNLGEHQLPNHLRLGLEHTAAAGEALGLPLRSIQLPSHFEHALTQTEEATHQNVLFDIKDPLSIAKEISATPLRQRLEKFASENPQFQRNGWAQITDFELGNNNQIFVLTRLEGEKELTLLKENLGGRYEMFDLETGQPKHNGVGLYKVRHPDGEVTFQRGGLLGGGDIDWKKTYPQFAKDLEAWTQRDPSSEKRQRIYRKIDDWMSTYTAEDVLALVGCELEHLPPLPPFVENLNLSRNRLTTLDNLPTSLKTLSANGNSLTNLPATLPAQLRTLEVSSNLLSTLPNNLPNTLRKLSIASNQLIHIPKLPNTIEHLDINSNPLTTLSELPSCLQYLDASHNRITNLSPTIWPTELRILKLNDNRLTGLNTLPARLETLNLANNQHFQNWPQAWPITLKELRFSNCELTTTTTMPRLPMRIEYLDFSDNQLLNLPEYLPNNLKQLLFPNNRVSTMPALPIQLKALIASNNQISIWPTSLPASLIEISLYKNRLTGVIPNNLPRGLKILNVADNELTAIPHSLPSTLTTLKVGTNHLTRLPDTLPETLTELSAANNHLTSLPPLPKHLKTLVIAHNELNSLPTLLPTTLHALNADHNQLTALPPIPEHIGHLDVSNNQLTTLPDLPLDITLLNIEHNQLTSLSDSLIRQGRGRGHTIYAQGNPFSAAFLLAVEATPRRARPRLFIDGLPPIPPVVPQALSLGHVVGKWFSIAERNSNEVIWNAFKDEPNASDFAQLMDRLAITKAALHEAFQTQVRELLRHASQDSELRTQLFAIAQEGIGSCVDRTVLIYNDMSTIQIVLQAERGAYDKRIHTLIPLARQMFRHDQLAKIAAQKMQEIAKLDAIEVYLAFQIKLRNELQLATPVTEMQFSSLLPSNAFTTAARQVKQAENSQFIQYLSSEWQPWQRILQRLDIDAYNRAKEKIDQQSEIFESTLIDYLDKNGLPNTEQMRAEYGPKLSEEMRHAVYRELTENFVSQQKLSDLLKPFWENIEGEPSSSSSAK